MWGPLQRAIYHVMCVCVCVRMYVCVHVCICECVGILFQPAVTGVSSMQCFMYL